MIEAIESDASPALLAEPRGRRMRLWWSSMTGVLTPLRRRHRRAVMKANRNRRKATAAAAATVGPGEPGS